MALLDRGLNRRGLSRLAVLGAGLRWLAFLLGQRRAYDRGVPLPDILGRIALHGGLWLAIRRSGGPGRTRLASDAVRSDLLLPVVLLLTVLAVLS
jgi:hypothetical protein